MEINKKFYLYSLKEYIDNLDNSDNIPYSCKTLAQIKTLIDYDATLPVDLTDTNIIKLWNEIYSRYYEHIIASQEEETISTDIFKKWFYKFISLLSRTSDYYLTLLTLYANNKANLMADIKATSINKTSYNDTPQNIDTEGEYQEDDHLTNFTKVENETSSPLTSKIARLKEIQDAYKRTLAEWTQEFERLFFEEEN